MSKAVDKELTNLLKVDNYFDLPELNKLNDSIFLSSLQIKNE